MIRAVLLFLAVLLVAPQAYAQKKLTLLFTGDNGGEVAPCG